MVTNYRYSFPQLELSPYVRLFWISEGIACKKKPYVHSRFPGGFCDLLYIYKGNFVNAETGTEFKEGDLIVGGPKDILSRYLIEENFGTFSICLYPYVLPLLTRFSGDSLLNQVLEGALFNNMKRLHELLKRTKNNQERIEVSSNVIGQLLREDNSVDRSFLSLVRTMYKPNSWEINKFSENANMSLRHFQRKFKDYTGFTPKKLQRIVRLHSAISSGVTENLTRLAIDSGFYDQAHFINDFKKIACGLTPSEYFKRQEEHRWRKLGANVAFFQSS